MSNVQDQSECVVVVDNRLTAYKSFFDHPWAKGMFDRCDGTKVEPLFFDLCADWKGAANSFRSPWLMVTALKNFHAGFTEPRPTFWNKLASAFRDHIINHRGINLPRSKRREIAKIIDGLSQQVQAGIAAAPPILNVDDVWNQYLQQREFALSIWSMQRLCYGAVFHAYENFLRRTVGISKGSPEYRSRKICELRSDMDRYVGSGLGNLCLAGKELERARLVRNAIAHNGGRATPELRDDPGQITISSDGMIHIQPDDTRILFDLLKNKVTCLVEKIRLLPVFS